MLETYRVSGVRFALAVMLGVSRHDDRRPAKLVAGDVDRQPVPLEPRMGVAPAADIVRRILIDIIGGDPQPLDQVAAKQLRGMSAGSSWVCDRRHLKVCSPDNDFSDISGTWATLHASTAPLAR